MPRAGDHARFDRGSAERRAHVRTGIVDRKIAARLMKDRDQPLANGKCLALALWNRTNLGDSIAVCGCCLTVVRLDDDGFAAAVSHF